MQTETSRDPRAGPEAGAPVPAGAPRWRALLEARWQARLQEVTELALAYHDAAAAADRGPGGHERQVRLRSLLRRTIASRRALADTEEALARLSAGRYGWCEGCAGAIPAERLAVTPETRYCARCDGGRPGMARDGRLRWPAWHRRRRSGAPGSCRAAATLAVGMCGRRRGRP